MRRLTFLFSTGLCLITLLLAGCGENPDELAIKNGIISMATAVEEHDADTFMQHISEDYRDSRVHNKKGIRTVLEYYLDENPEINLIITTMEIKFAEKEDEATARFRVLSTGGKGKLPERGRLNEITSVWHKQDDAWYLTRAKWRPVLLNLE